MGRSLTMLGSEGRRRGLVQPDRTLDAETAFPLVREMPYRRASTREPESVVREWLGACSGKRYLLDRIFREEGMESRVMMCTHRFTAETTGNFPAELRQMAVRDPVPDVHTYIRLKTSAGWMTVDATWPAEAANLGMTVNHGFQPGIDMTLACIPIDTHEVPEVRDPQAFKEELIESFCGPQTGARDRFIDGMGTWLSKPTS